MPGSPARVLAARVIDLPASDPMITILFTVQAVAAAVPPDESYPNQRCVEEPCLRWTSEASKRPQYPFSWHSEHSVIRLESVIQTLPTSEGFVMGLQVLARAANLTLPPVPLHYPSAELFIRVESRRTRERFLGNPVTKLSDPSRRETAAVAH